MSGTSPVSDRAPPQTRIHDPARCGGSASRVSDHEFSIPLQIIASEVYYGGGGKYLYQPITKCACTTIKSLLLEFEGLSVDENEWRRHQKRHNKFPGISALTSVEQRDVLEGRTNTFKFVIVRNPYSRLASVYLDKIFLRPQKYWIRPVKKSATLFGMALSDPITFEEFVGVISRQCFADMDVHWRPQFYEGRFGYIKYDFVGKMEMMPSHLIYALERIGAPKAIIAQAFRRYNRTDASLSLWSNVSEDTRRLYFTTFHLDFDTLQYPRRLPSGA
jgi:hypothetical protein